MRKVTILFFGACVVALPQLVFAAGASFMYAGWIPFWKDRAGALDTARNLEKLREVSPFSYEVKPDGTLVDKLKLGEGFWPTWLSAVRDARVKIVPTIAWFDGAGIHALLSNKKTRIAHEDAIASLAERNKFDGIDIDYESKLAETKEYFSLFIQGLAIRLHPKNKLLSCTIEARTPLTSLYETMPEDLRRANDYAVLNRYCDEVRVMAYDQGLIDIKLNAEKGTGALYAPVADPAWVEKVLRETMKTINKKKIVLGIPTYGYEYQVSWKDGRTTYERLRSHTFFQAMNRAAAVRAVALRNSAGELSFTYTTSTRVTNVAAILTRSVSSSFPAALLSGNTTSSVMRLVSFTDAVSVAEKISLAKKLGIRGAVFFKLDGEHDPLLWRVMK